MKKKFDLLICGRQAIDGDTAQSGPQVADHLGIPHVSYVSEIEEINENHIIVKRNFEDSYERIRCKLPSLLTVTGDINTPRYLHIGKLIKACKEKAPIKIWNSVDIGAQTSEVGLEGSLTHVIKTYVPQFKKDSEILEGSTEEKVRQLINRIESI